MESADVVRMPTEMEEGNAPGKACRVNKTSFLL